MQERSNIKLFIPDFKEPDPIYSNIKKYLNSLGFFVSDSKIYSITFNHNGRTITETVGEISTSNNEPVIAILRAENTYYTCTPNRGVIRGTPMLTSNVEKVVFFDDSID